MAYPVVTHNFVAGSAARAAEVNQNFTDVINGISDGTKALNVAALACTTLAASSTGSFGGIVTCDGLLVESADTTDKCILAIGRTAAEVGTFIRATTYRQNFVCDSGTLTDDGVLLLSAGASSSYGGNGWGYVSWYASGAIGQNCVNFTFTYTAGTTTLSLTAAGPSTASFDSANTDGKMCIYVSGNDLVLKNRTGATVKLSFFMVGIRNNES